MDRPRTVHVALELNSSEPINGRLTGPSGPTEPFRGWLELAAKLDRLRAAPENGERPKPRAREHRTTTHTQEPRAPDDGKP